MKNLFRLSTGIVFIISILVTVGCKPQGYYKNLNPYLDPNHNPKDNKVEIYIRLAIDTISGKKYLEMRDTLILWVKDSLLETDVIPGVKVKWIIDDNLIKEIVKIKGKTGKIFKNDPSKILLSKNFSLKLADKIDPGTEEKYYIKFKIYGDTITYKTDPMLRVPTSKEIEPQQ